MLRAYEGILFFSEQRARCCEMSNINKERQLFYMHYQCSKIWAKLVEGSSQGNVMAMHNIL